MFLVAFCLLLNWVGQMFKYKKSRVCAVPCMDVYTKLCINCGWLDLDEENNRREYLKWVLCDTSQKLIVLL